MLERLHLLRHGEVHNPDHLCYADLPGFDLSDIGRLQARAAAAHLAETSPGAVVVSSPLDRALQTAEIVGDALGAETVRDVRLVEWGLSWRWAGVAWEDLPELFPGELEAYLDHPHDLPFSPESLDAVADRMVAAVADLTGSPAAVVVSHQDPIQALRLRLGGRSMAGFNDGKPHHCEVLTLHRLGSAWEEIGRWTPGLPGTPFPPEPASR